MTRTLVIQLGRLGDVIQTTPLLSALAASGDTVDVLVLRSVHEPLLGFSAVSNIITIPDSLNPLDDAIACGFPRGATPVEAHVLLADLQLPCYDRVINASHAPLGCWLAAGIPCTDPGARYGGIIRHRECLYLGPASVYRIAALQFREQNLFNLVDLLRAAPGVVPCNSLLRLDTNRPCLYVNQSAELPFELPGGRKVALNPGASEATRCWPAENFARLAEHLSYSGLVPILVGATSDRELCENIQSTAAVTLSNLAGRTTIPEMVTLLARCELLVSVDTGAAHLAAAVGTTVVGLYGAKAWFAETAPYGDNHVILQTPLNAPMSTISIDAVRAAALNRLGRLSSAELRRELQSQNQSAWETSIHPPSSIDPLGGLTYRPMHRDLLTPDELFFQSLRQAFATEFLSIGNPGSVKSTRREVTDILAGSEPGQSSRTDISAGGDADSLAQILDHMQRLANICGESVRTRTALAETTSAASTLIAATERLRALTAEPRWICFRSVIHLLDWQLRMLPQQPPEGTFHAHASAYASAARILRNATQNAPKALERTDPTGKTTNSESSIGRGLLPKAEKRGDRCLVR